MSGIRENLLRVTERIEKAAQKAGRNLSDIRLVAVSKTVETDRISNVSRGKRKKQDQHEWMPCILEPEGSSKEYRKNWARLIQKIYEADPLTCPKCQGRMKIISFIEDEEVIEKILKHLGPWDLKARPPPRAKTPSVTICLDDSDSQISSPDSFYAHPDCPMDFYVS